MSVVKLTRLTTIFVTLRIVICLTGFILCLSGVTAWAKDRVFDRPDILNLSKASSTENINARRWDNSKSAYLEMIALVIGLYPEHNYYFLARDAEYMYDLMRWLYRDQPAVLSRIKLLSLSRGIYGDPNLPDYLRQEGFTEINLRERPALLIDSGYLGTTLKVVHNFLPAEFRERVEAHFIGSHNSIVPSVHSALVKVNEHYRQSALKLVDLYESAEALAQLTKAFENIPHHTAPAKGLRFEGGRWLPVYDDAVDAKKLGWDESADFANPSTAIAYMRDIRREAGKTTFQNALRERIKIWRELVALSGDPVSLANRFVTLMKHTSTELIPVDFLEYAMIRLPAYRLIPKHKGVAEFIMENARTENNLVDSPKISFTDRLARADYDQLNQMIEKEFSTLDMENLRAAVAYAIKNGNMKTYSLLMQFVLPARIQNNPEWVEGVLKILTSRLDDYALQTDLAGIIQTDRSLRFRNVIQPVMDRLAAGSNAFSNWDYYFSQMFKPPLSVAQAQLLKRFVAKAPAMDYWGKVRVENLLKEFEAVGTCESELSLQMN